VETVKGVGLFERTLNLLIM